jgi:hypothetical protein
MALQTVTPTIADTVLPSDEGRALFDREARRLLGIDGEEFLRRWNAGEYRDLPESPAARKAMRVAFLIPFVRSES